MGDVLMTTAQLAGLKRSYPQSSIYWITLPIAAPLLQNNPYLEQVFAYSFESLSILTAMEFDIVLSCDKSQRSAALAGRINGREKRGFGLDVNGKIYPYNDGAFYNFRLGMDDELKFKKNTLLGQQYLADTFEIPYTRDGYVFNFSSSERKFIEERRTVWQLLKGNTIGFNTGCSNLFPNKKMTVPQHIHLIERLLSETNYTILLLGGPEDTERNAEIGKPFQSRVINTPSTDGVRRGACYMDLADLVITGDSFGMHLAIALRKQVIAWFGLSCWTEIDLYDRGVKIFPEHLDCAPCWKKECPYNLECRDSLNPDLIISHAKKIMKAL